MAAIRERVPEKSAVFAVLAVCVIPIHIWSIINFFYVVPGALMRKPLWEVLGIFAYIQVAALIETLFFAGLIVGTAFILPGKMLRERLSVSGFVIMFILSIWFAAFHFWAIRKGVQTFTSQDVQPLTIWGFSLVAGLVVTLWVTNKWEFMAASVGRLITPLTTLAVVYVAIDIVCLLIIVIRNLSL